MFNEISQMLYAYIVQAEMIFLDVYKINPWEVMDNLAVIDLQFYIKRLEKEWTKKNEKFKKKDVLEALRQINDILNFVFNKK